MRLGVKVNSVDGYAGSCLLGDKPRLAPVIR